MSMLVNPFIIAAAAAAGIQYVGGLEVDGSAWSNVSHTISLSGTLTGGIASSPQAGDFCIVSFCAAGTADRSGRSVSNAIGEFNLLYTVYVSDTNDTSMTVKYKFLESPIDYDVIAGAISSSSNGINVSIQVFRGVNVASPFDVTSVSASALNTALADPGSITPTTAGSVIAMFAAGAMGASISTAFTSSAYDTFTAVTRPGTSRSLATGFGRKAWTSGAFDAAALGGPSVNTADSNAYVTFALRPA